MSKNNQFETGSTLSKSQIMELYSHIQIAKGYLATLELEPLSLWTKKYLKTPKEHLRILLLEVMEEIYMMEKILNE